ncbi:hypothetical protein GUJ93_ZPchr0005g15826 [Zizania palustris]|uniref:Uncharacterized protein n=1 Tax=Zizania palustris TaxID=103762 RepID=A0A8J5SQN6_ZIZPA|nr:hypothetical protein GUJ93_ZPchr0005g15826 [Zizania palustris]
MEPSTDDVALMADKRAMEQVALAAPSLVAKAEAQGGGEGEVAIGRTLAELPPPQAASALEKATIEAHRVTPTVKTSSRVESLCAVIPATPDEAAFIKIGGWRGRAPRSGLPLEPPSPPHATSTKGVENLLSVEGRWLFVVARWAMTGGHGAATEGARVGRCRLLRGRAWRRRLRRGTVVSSNGGDEGGPGRALAASKGPRVAPAASEEDGGVFDGSRAPSRRLRRGMAASSKRVARPAGSFGGGPRTSPVVSERGMQGDGALEGAAMVWTDWGTKIPAT